MNFTEFRVWFDERFAELLKQKVEKFASMSSSADVATIVSYIPTIAQEGKRFRPFVLYCATGMDRKQAEDIFWVLAGVELLHIFALIHDDIMDEADTRHGVVCAHKKFAEEYGDMTAEAVGILLGDMVFAWAYECINAYTARTPEFHVRMTEEFTRLVSEVTHGQLLDILSPTQAPLDSQAIVEKMTLKTARYSFVQPLRMGFVVRGDNPNDHLFAERFGLALGVGFQLQDDLLDSALSTQTGKTRFTDIQSRQQTLLSWYMQHNATPDEQIQFSTFFGTKDMTEDMQEVLFQLLVSSGAIAYVEARVATYFADADRVIQDTRSDDAQLWHDMLTLVQSRKK
jgi:geranylgeranyl diphosphate synthase type I